MSTSQELIAEMKSMGVSQKAIADVIGRNDSLISQISRGKKPGNNLRDSLTQLRDQLAGGAPVRSAQVAEPPRRMIGDRLARVRRPTTIHGASGRWSTTTLKRQASRSGGRGALHAVNDAARSGQSVAVTVGLVGVDINNLYGSRRPAPRGGSAVDIHLGDASDVLADLESAGDNFTEYVLGELIERGHITTGQDVTDLSAGVQSIEVRTY